MARLEGATNTETASSKDQRSMLELHSWLHCSWIDVENILLLTIVPLPGGPTVSPFTLGLAPRVHYF